MKETLLLTKILLKTSFTSNKNQKKFSFKSLILYLAVFAYIIGFFGYMSYSNLILLIPLHYDMYYLDIYISAVMLYICIRSAFTAINTLYFSKDTEQLLPLPIKEKNIVRAKILALIINQYLIVAVFLLPTLIIYGILKARGIDYYLIALFDFIIMPIIPTMIITFLISLIIKFTRKLKGRDFIQYLSIIITFAVVFGVQYSSTKLGDNYTGVELGNFIYGMFEKTNNYSMIFFTKPFMVNLLIEENIKNILIMMAILLGSSLLTIYLFTFVISKSYIKVITNMKEIKAKKFKGEEKIFNQRSIVKSYFTKEYKMLTRNSTFMIQCIISMVIFPFIVLAPILFQFMSGDPESSLIEAINILCNFMGNSTTGFGTLLLILTFIFLFNQASITAISRDGEDAKLIKIFPVKPSTQIFSKILPGLIVNLLVNLFIVILIIIANIIMKNNFNLEPLSIKMIAYLIIHITIITLINNFIFALIDLKNPKLHWSTETQVTKQNINMLFQAAIVILEMMLYIGLSFGIKNLNAYSLVLFILELIMALIVRKIINNKNIFDKIN